MATSTILLDSTILIDFFRKQNKAKSILFQLTDEYQFCVSVITNFEIQIGLVSERQQQDYQILMQNIEILPLDQFCINQAVEIYRFLKPQNAQVGLADLLIAATTIYHNLSLATLNQKHFKRIPQLPLIDLRSYQTTV